MSKSFLFILISLSFIHLAILFVSFQLQDKMKLSVSKSFSVQLGEMKQEVKKTQLKNFQEKNSNPLSEARLEPEEATQAVSQESGQAQDGPKNDYKAELRELIEKNKYYPTMSQRLGQTGTVVISFLILGDGTISDVKIDSPSAFERLNQAALEAVQKVVKFKPIPKEFGQDKMELRVPLKFVIL